MGQVAKAFFGRISQAITQGMRDEQSLFPCLFLDSSRSSRETESERAIIDRATQERIALRYRELTEHFGRWEKTKDLIDQLIDIIANYRQSGRVCVICRLGESLAHWRHSCRVVGRSAFFAQVVVGRNRTLCS
jgi:hypothetical protein